MRRSERLHLCRAFWSRVVRSLVLIGAAVYAILGCLAKRKQALRGRNLPRDSQAKGAPRACPGLWGAWHASGPFCLPWTPLPCLRKSNRWQGENGCVCWVGLVSLRGGRSEGIPGGTISPIRRCSSGATRRVDSSLRSHRTRRSQCRRVYPGLNKTLFASVGPNLCCRSYRLRSSAGPECSPRAEEHAANRTE